MKPIDINQIKYFTSPRYATASEREEAKEYSRGLNNPVAFVGDDGKLLTCCNCYGGAGQFPLVCREGKEAYWSVESVQIGTNRKILPTGNSEMSIPAFGQDDMGSRRYNGYRQTRWHITGWIGR